LYSSLFKYFKSSARGVQVVHYILSVHFQNTKNVVDEIEEIQDELKRQLNLGNNDIYWIRNLLKIMNHKENGFRKIASEMLDKDNEWIDLYKGLFTENDSHLEPLIKKMLDLDVDTKDVVWPQDINENEIIPDPTQNIKEM